MNRAGVEGCEKINEEPKKRHDGVLVRVQQELRELAVQQSMSGVPLCSQFDSPRLDRYMLRHVK